MQIKMFKWWLFDGGRDWDVCGGMEVSTFLRCNWLERRGGGTVHHCTVQYCGVYRGVYRGVYTPPSVVTTMLPTRLQKVKVWKKAKLPTTLWSASSQRYTDHYDNNDISAQSPRVLSLEISGGLVASLIMRGVLDRDTRTTVIARRPPAASQGCHWERCR